MPAVALAEQKPVFLRQTAFHCIRAVFLPVLLMTCVNCLRYPLHFASLDVVPNPRRLLSSMHVDITYVRSVAVG